MKYEMMIIIRPVEKRLVEITLNKVLNVVRELGTLINVDDFGRKALAYEIKGETEGVYVAITFDSEFPKVIHLDRKMYQFDEVIRHMIVWKGGEIMGKDKCEESEGGNCDD